MRSSVLFLSFVTLCCTAMAAHADDSKATKDEAVAFVKKAIEELKAKGPTETFADIMNKSGPYIKGDLYLTAYDTTGKCLAHGQNPVLVGHDLMALKDIDGTPFIQERIEMGLTKQSFWQSYKYMDPITHTVSPKDAYCEKFDTTLICGGVYH
ncbi:MAG: cache domain-containing protein [Alphaproteobacteria bacterium]|nr:cache domain-containing protein [Alphaproteobacteria bacterium]MBV8549329.1 cache domain-containing protein [Alphaproteobacteria bacterium]